MNRLDVPDIRVGDFFKSLVSNKHNNKKNNYLKSRLLLAEANICHKETEYLKKALDGELHLVESIENIPICTWSEACDIYETDASLLRLPKEAMEALYNSGDFTNITTKEMEKLYEQNFVASKVGRRIYDSILNSVEDNICPYCSQRLIKTLDHYLPKSIYPYFSVTPINLVPACRDCNTCLLYTSPSPRD